MKGHTWMWAAAALLIGAAGCKSNSGKLSVSAGTAQTTTDGGVDAGTSGPLDLKNGILVDRVRIVVRDIELEGAVAASDAGTGADAGMPTTMLAARSSQDHGGSGGGGDDGSGHDGNDDGEHHDEGEVKVGPFLADMTGADLASGVTQVFDTDVPAGTYEEVKITIHSVSSSDAGTGTSIDPGIVAMNGQTVIVDGTVAPCPTTSGASDGGTAAPTPFSFQTQLTAKQKQEGEIVVASDGSTKNITLHVDPTEWFGACPARLDPNNPADADAIRKNIKDSLRVFEDDDHNGCDDHGEHGSGHH